MALYNGHARGILVNDDAVKDPNSSLSSGVTFGEASTGARAGCPATDCNVCVVSGAAISGKNKLWSLAGVGAGFVAVEDILECDVVGGDPAKAISRQSSIGCINLSDHPRGL